MKLISLCLTAILLIGCDGSNLRPVSETNANAAAANREKPQTAIAHSGENKMPPAYSSNSNAAPGGRWSQGGDAIDTTKLDSAVMSAEKALTAKPNDASAKNAAANAFLARATALTEARQYASALGDYRRTLKHEPSNADAKQWVDQITMIYASLGRDAPKEGEEPPPLQVKNEK